MRRNFNNANPKGYKKFVEKDQPTYKDFQMSTNTKATQSKTVEERLSELEVKSESLTDNLDRAARSMGDLDERINALASAADAPADPQNLSPEVKKNLLAGLKQTTTTRKVVYAALGTAAVVGVGYAGYRGVGMYKERKTAQPEVLSVTHVESPAAVSKADAIRQGLGIK